MRDPDVVRIVDTLRGGGRTVQLWTCTELRLSGPFGALPPAQHQTILERTVTHLPPLAEHARAEGHTLGLYAHLG